MQYRCTCCNKTVTSQLPKDSIIRAVLVCPECIKEGRVLFPEDEGTENLTNNLKDCVTIEPASKILNVSTKTLRRWDKSGKFKAKRHPINNYRIYLRRDLIHLANNIRIKKEDKELEKRSI